MNYPQSQKKKSKLNNKYLIKYKIVLKNKKKNQWKYHYLQVQVRY